MRPHKTLTAPRLFVFFALVILPGLCFGRPRVEIFARPVVQYTWLPSSARDANISNLGGGVAPMNPTTRNDHYTASSDGVGGGLVVGMIAGEHHQFEIGLEGTLTRFSGSYLVTPNPYYTMVGSQAIRHDEGTSSARSCTIVVRSVLATFRQFLGKESDKIRPYLGFFLGTQDAKFQKVTNVTYYDYRDTGNKIATGLNGGALFKLARKTYLEAGYRFLYTNEIGSDKGLYRISHTVSLALNQRF